MDMDINAMSRKIAELEGRRLEKQERLSELQMKIKSDTKHMEDALKARSIVQIVAAQTQKKIEFHISNLVSMALAAVFPEPYEFKLRYEIRRNKTEADLIFTKRGNETDDILFGGGGGVADISALALRIAAWSLKRNRPTLILDEPTKFLHNPSYQAKASMVLKELSDSIGIQIIMVSDQDEIIEAADKEIKVANIDGNAIIETQ